MASSEREQVSGSVRADEVLSQRELQRRFGWQEHSLRQARLAGLRTVQFGRERYVIGADVLDFFRKLAEKGDRPCEE